MKLGKILSTATVLVLAVSASVGATSASASFKELTMCKEHENVCKTGNILRELHGAATNPIFLGVLNEKCKSSSVVFKETGLATSTVITGQINTLVFTGCEPCTTITTFPPYAATAEKVAFILGGSVLLSGCPFGINCRFGTKGAALEYGKNGNGLVVELIADQEVFILEEGSEFFCGGIGKLDAKYIVSIPFLFLDEREVA